MNLVYTFTRSGATTAALTVSYSVGGSATLGTDYTGIAATPATKTVTFAAGASTATVTVDPTADALVEGNETVELSLVAGTGYSIGTSGAVIGTITNDDLPVITLAVLPASVMEDGLVNLVYTFTRSGATTAALTVSYSVGGSATLGTDYTGIAATPATKTVTFAAGASTATVTVDPTADALVEGDETVELSLVAGTGYSIGTGASVVGIIGNDDGESDWQLFANRGLIQILDDAEMLPSSKIVVDGLTGIVNGVTVTLCGLTHGWTDDLDVALVSPSGQGVMLMSDVQGSAADATFKFSDRAKRYLESQASTPFSDFKTGVYRPTEVGGVSDLTDFEKPYSAALSVFNGSSPNGEWTLRVRDDMNLFDGEISGGWILEF